MREDPRRVRTRQALGEALLRVLRSTPLDDVTVTQLCREAGVHRTTFYAHADSVPAFAVMMVSREVDDDSTVGVSPGSETPDESAAQYLQALSDMFAHVVAERSLYRPLFASTSRGALRVALDQRLRHRVGIALDVLAKEGVPDVPLGPAGDEAVAFIAGGLGGVLEAWSREDDEDAAAAARRVLRLMPPWWPLHDA